MSLVVWLPLTKDLRQQGLSSATVINNGATFDSAGKLGGCYTFGSGKYMRATPASSLMQAKAVSVACWVKITSWNSSYDCLMSWADGTSWTNSRVTLARNNTSSKLCFTIANGTNYTTVNCTTNLALNTWYHIVGTYDGSNIKIYINGNLEGTATSTLSIVYAGAFNIGGWSGNNYPINGSLSDIRLYNHCLSPMEVKELAKGLVLHYPLNRQGWGQENLLPGSYRADGNTTNRIYGWQANGNGAPEIVNINGTNCIHLQASCTGKYIPSIVSASKVFLEYGIEYTISCDLKFDKDITVTNSTPIHYHSGSSSSTDEFNTANINNGHGFNFKSISPAAGTTIPANTWQHYEQHIIAKTAPTDSSLPYLTYRAFIYGSVRTISETVSVNMWLKNWKLEKGSVATPWCPNSADTLATTMGLNSTTEYDCSGFCNNGTRTGTFTWISNTPKYAVSQVFNGTDNAIQTPSLPTMITDKNYTIAVWIYKTVIGSKSYQTIYGGPSGFEIEARNGGANETKFVPWNWGKPMASYELNEWNHCVFVHSDADCKIYLNGEYIATGTAKASNPTGNYFIGAWNTATQQNFDGLMSDFRIYATALSADDVKSLYQNCATIDPDGTIRGQIRS